MTLENLESAPRRRGSILEGALLSAAWSVLTEDGYPGFTYDAIAAQAHTSRAVLYRRWPQRDDLLRATLAKYWQPLEVPDTGNLRDDAIEFLRGAADKRAGMITMISVQLAGYYRDSRTSPADLRNLLRPPDRQSPFATIISHAVERGELADIPRPQRVVDLPFDLLRHDMLMHMGPIPDDSIVEIVDQVWLPLLHKLD